MTDEPDIAAVDDALAHLTSAATADDRFSVLQLLVKYWHGPILPQDARNESSLSCLRLPQPLRRWYLWAGNRAEIMSGQNFLLAPDEVKMEDDRLLFYLENQSVYRWATLPEGDDPPVFGRNDAGEPWQLEGLSLSAHLIWACLFEAILCHSPFGASSASVEEKELEAITSNLRPILIGAWRWPGETHLYAGHGAFALAARNSTRKSAGYSIWIGAKTLAALDFLRPLVNSRWEYISL